MRIRDEVFVKATLDAVFQAAAAIERWPSLLPHCRDVRILKQAGDDRLVEVTLWYDVVPVRWQVLQQVNSDQNRVQYRHTNGLMRGTHVYWFIRPANEAIRVAVVHDMTLEVRLLRNYPVKWLLANLVFRPLIQRTLIALKRHAEQEEADRLAAQDRAIGRRV